MSEERSPRDYLLIIADVKQFFYIAAILAAVITALVHLAGSVDDLTEATLENTAVTTQVERILRTQGFVSSPLAPGQSSSSGEPESPLTAPQSLR